MNADSWWNGLARCAVIAAGWPRSACPYAYPERASVVSQREQVARNGGRAIPVAHVSPGASTTSASALALARRNRTVCVSRSRRMLGQEPVERLVAVPERDEPDPPELG